MTELKLASFNIYKHLSDSRTWDDLRDLLAVDGLDVAGLQEINWELKDSDLSAAWDVWQPNGREARKDPIIWRTYLKPLETGNRRISDRIENDSGVVVARDGVWAVFPEFIHINCHLNANVEKKPGVPDDLPRNREHYKSLLGLVELADELQDEYNLPVFISGDFNVDYGADRRVKHPHFPYSVLGKAGFTCCWEGVPEESTRRKRPKAGRTIDHIWARGTSDVRVKFHGAHTPNRWGKNDPVESDHLPVIVNAELIREAKSMARSQNGYPANDVNRTIVKRIPGTRREIRLAKGEPGWLLRDFASWFDKHIETIDNDGILDDWGYAARPVRGGTDLSNHASGTAMDLNAPEHPLGIRNTFSNAQERAIRKELEDTYRGLIRWGGDYTKRADEMHFEIVGSREAVRELAVSLRRQRRKELPGKVVEEVKRRVLSTIVLANIRKQVFNYLEGRKVEHRGGVEVIQRHLNKLYGTDLKIDGYWGDGTNAVWRRHERRSGVSGRPGVPDMATLLDLSQARFLIK